MRTGCAAEAKVLAALNHPGIAAIYGIEESDGVRALVLELVEGETLSDRLGSTPRRMSLDETLAIARQIADALYAAHERGIIHRDLKPADVGLTRPAPSRCSTSASRKGHQPRRPVLPRRRLLALR
jgi:serine/threonine-protein kinase